MRGGATSRGSEGSPGVWDMRCSWFSSVGSVGSVGWWVLCLLVVFVGCQVLRFLWRFGFVSFGLIDVFESLGKISKGLKQTANQARLLRHDINTNKIISGHLHNLVRSSQQLVQYRAKALPLVARVVQYLVLPGIEWILHNYLSKQFSEFSVVVSICVYLPKSSS